MEENRYIVYKHTSPSGKIYIGMTKQSANGRWKNGLGYKSSPYLWNAIQKYGWENFEHEVLASGLCVEDACNEEKRFIKEYNATNKDFGYNEKSGGQKGSFLSKEVREKMSANKRLFYKEHPEERKALSDKIRGFHHTEETKEKMRRSAKNRHYTLTDEWKKSIGKANKKRISEDKTLYEETCKRCRENGNKYAKAVVQLSKSGKYVQSFSSSHEAERITGIANGNISRCCRGKSKTAGGYKWQYAVLYKGGRETA